MSNATETITMQQKTVVSGKSLSKVFNDGSSEIHVLKDVNLTIAEAEMVAIIGASGSGKSTLLHILGALDDASNGSVSFLGQDLASLSSNKQAKLRNQHLGFVYQFHHLLPEFTALENIVLPQLANGIAKSDAEMRARDLLTRVGIAHREDHRPAALSGGERRRVALVRLLIQEPDILLLDEPTASMDSEARVKTLGLLRQLCSENIALLVTSHDPELFQGIASRFLHLENQQITSDIYSVDNTV